MTRSYSSVVSPKAASKVQSVAKETSTPITGMNKGTSPKANSKQTPKNGMTKAMSVTNSAGKSAANSPDTKNIVPNTPTNKDSASDAADMKNTSTINRITNSGQENEGNNVVYAASSTNGALDNSSTKTAPMKKTVESSLGNEKDVATRMEQKYPRDSAQPSTVDKKASVSTDQVPVPTDDSGKKAYQAEKRRQQKARKKQKKEAEAGK
jgi:hypothetical protein